jgi:hypothetical protein
MSKAKAETVTEPTVEIFCSICGRVKWGNWQPLGNGKGRHDECALGSEAWREYYLALSPSEKEPLREFFVLSYPQVEDKPTGEVCANEA